MPQLELIMHPKSYPKLTKGNYENTSEAMTDINWYQLNLLYSDWLRG